MDVFLFTTILSVCAAAAHIFLVVFLLLRLLHPSFIQPITNTLRRHGLLLASLIAVISTVSPLIFAFVYQFEPCLLCWFQRVFMFPLAFLLPVMWLRNDYGSKIYVYILASVGLGIGLYQWATQLVNKYTSHAVGGCSADPTAPQCSAYFFMEFGYITIPAMAVTGFILILLLVRLAGR